MNADDIKAKIRIAEAAVAGMSDEALKKSAFETVLSKLLGGDSDRGGAGGARVSPKKRAPSSKAGKSPKGQETPSTLELSVEQLKDLKSSYDLHAPDGTEEAVFSLAYYIHENLGQKKFHEGDLLRVYQNLLPLKPVTKPPAMTVSELNRAIRWLVAPSRKKQWLRDTSDGQLEVTPQGMLRMTYGLKAQEKQKKTS